MKKQLFFFLFFLSLSIYGQYGSLVLYSSIELNDSDFVLSVGRVDLQKCKCPVDSGYDYTILMDSLLPGNYTVTVVSEKEGKLFFSKNFEITAGNITTIDIGIDVSVSNRPKDKQISRREKSDGELNLAYIDNKLLDPKGVFSNGFLIGLGGHMWNAFSKHLGLLMGGGASYRYNQVISDTSFIDGGSYKKKHEAYNYLDAHIDAKIRLSGGNQQGHAAMQNFLLELGAVYNFPLFFRYTGRYEGNKKITAQGIHQYTDVRAFINIGYYPFLLFYEYRLSDFVSGKYPELPHSTIGIRILLYTRLN